MDFCPCRPVPPAFYKINQHTNSWQPLTVFLDKSNPKVINLVFVRPTVYDQRIRPLPEQSLLSVQDSGLQELYSQPITLVLWGVLFHKKQPTQLPQYEYEKRNVLRSIHVKNKVVMKRLPKHRELLKRTYSEV